jgi:sugar-specific transcriptional regulator TrmB
MSDQTDNLLNLVKPYGLSDGEGELYLYLLKHDFVTALNLSKQLHMGRTKVYRLLDKLRARHLVEYKLSERGMRFGATSPQKFQQLVIEKEQQAESLRASLPELLAQLQQLAPASTSKSKVLYYQGIEGLKQVSYNITRAKDMLRVFEMEHLSDFLPFDFSEDIRHKLVKNRVQTRDLTNKKSFSGFTYEAKLIKDCSQFRYVDPKKLRINFEVLIYNDVYATYTYKDREIFCVEIYNSQLAKMQKQLFDFIWQQAKPMKFIDERGGAKLLR